MDISRIVQFRFATAFAAVLMLTGQAWSVDVRFLFDDADGTGFFDPVQGPARQQAIQAAGDVWGQLIRPSYDGEEILVRAKFDTYPAGSTILAAAKPSHLYSDFGSSSPQYLTETNYPKALANHLAGRDLAPERHDIEITFNMAANFYYGLDGMPGAQLDFVTTAAHELGHGMGFYDSFRDDGDFGLRGDFSFDDLTCNECLPTPYDTFLTLSPLGPALTSLSSANRESAVTSDNVYWNGASGITGGGSAPRISAPATFNEQSSISHLHQSLGTLMVPNYPGVIQSLSPVERGMLRDMGWTISVASSSVNWTGLGADNKSSTAANWSPTLPLPGDSLGFGMAPQTDVEMDLVLPTLADITFAGDAPSYTLRFQRQRSTDLTGAGVVNNSSQPQAIIVENGLANSPDQRGATIVFKSSASAGSAAYELYGGGTSYESLPNLPPRYVWGEGASIAFEGTSNAGNATFTVEGGSGHFAPQATVIFRGNARADRAEFNNQGGHIGFALPNNFASGTGGETRFEGSSWAENARIRNYGEAEYNLGTGGATTFHDTSTAGDATIENFAATYLSGGIGGGTRFYDTSTAATGDFTNHGGASSNHQYGMGHSEFFDDARAGNSSTFTNLGGTIESRPGGATRFYNRSSAEGGTFVNRRSAVGGLGGATEFRDDATAANARFEMEGGRVDFDDRATAGNSTFHFVGAAGFPQMVSAGTVEFHGDATPGEADFVMEAFSQPVINFYDHSSAGQANFFIPRDAYAQFYFSRDSSASDRSYQIRANSALFFLHNSTAADARITIHPRGGSSFGQLELLTDVASAGNATIRVLGGDAVDPLSPGRLNFRQASSGGNATITAEGAAEGGLAGASIYFHPQSRLDHATLIAGSSVGGGPGGKFFLLGGATGDSAILNAEAGGEFDFADNRFFAGFEVGSIEGAGTFVLQGSLLTTGNLNANTTVAGRIVDGSVAGGSLTKVGTGTLTLAGTNAYTGLTTVSAGTLRVTGSVAGDARVLAGAALAGSGNVLGDVDSEPGSFVTPGTSPGILTVGGDFNQDVGGILLLEIGGTTPGADYDVLSVGGDASLAGQIVIQFINGFAPLAGQQFNLIAVGGASLSLPQVVVGNLAPGFQFESGFVGGQFQVTALNDGVFVGPTVPGDTNGDGKVDLEDLNNVRNNFGVMGDPILGDTNGDDVVDLVDLNAVRNNFGATGGARAVPEPPAIAILLTGLVVILSTRIRTRVRDGGVVSRLTPA